MGSNFIDLLNSKKFQRHADMHVKYFVIQKSRSRPAIKAVNKLDPNFYIVQPFAFIIKRVKISSQLKKILGI